LVLLLNFLKDDFIRSLVSGMETTLHLLMISIIGYLLVTWDGDSPQASSARHSVLTGLSLAALVLSRLDSVFFVAIVMAILGFQTWVQRWRGKMNVRHYIATVLVFLACLVPYFAWNWATFEHLIPISGLVKSSWPKPLLHFSTNIGGVDIRWWGWDLVLAIGLLFLGLEPMIMRLHGLPKSWVLLVLLLVVGLLGYRENKTLLLLAPAALFDVWNTKRTRQPDERWRGRWQLWVKMLIVYALLLFAYEYFFTKWGFMHWHFAFFSVAVAPLLTIAIAYTFAVNHIQLVPVIGRRVMERSGISLARLGLLSITALLAVRGFLATWSYHESVREAIKNQEYPLNWQMISYTAATWAKENTPPDAVFAMKDAGVFGYFSNRRVINLDGVINGFDYQEALRQEKGIEYLKGKGVRYFIQHAFWDPAFNEDAYSVYRHTLYSHLYDKAGGTLELSRSQEVYRSVPYGDGPKERTRMLIWELALDTASP